MYSAVNRGVTPVSFEQECCNYGFCIVQKMSYIFFIFFYTNRSNKKQNFVAKPAPYNERLWSGSV